MANPVVKKPSPVDRAALERELKGRARRLEMDLDQARLIMERRSGKPYEEAKETVDAIEAELREMQRKLRAFSATNPPRLALANDAAARQAALAAATRKVGEEQRALLAQDLPPDLLDAPAGERVPKFRLALSEAMRARETAATRAQESGDAATELEACIPRRLVIALSLAGVEVRRCEAAVRDARRELASLTFALKFNKEKEKTRGRAGHGGFDDRSQETRDQRDMVAAFEELLATVERDLTQAREVERDARVAWEQARARLFAGEIS